MQKTLFSGGRIFDGSGGTPFRGHVLVEGERIAAVLREGEVLPPADRTIDLAARAIAPGFIDMHSHADFLVPGPEHDDLVKSFLEQGVTSIVAGNCGISPAPISDRSAARVEHMAQICIDRPLSFEWRSMASYLEHLDTIKPAVNVAQLVGHASLRSVASDKERGALSSGELDRALDATRAAFDEGACGVSFGLGYDPGMYSSLEELEAFARVAARADRPVTVHLKAYSWISPCYPLTQPDRHNWLAVQEMLRVADRSDCRLQISHMIFVGRRTWSSAPRILEAIERAPRVGFDAFPYTCGNTTVNVTLPYWFLEKGRDAYRSRLLRARLRAEIELGYRLVGFEWSDFQVMQIGAPEWADLEGLSLEEIGRRWGTSAFDALLTIGERTDGAALMLLHAYSGDREGRGPIEDVIAHPNCLIETDAIVRSTGWPNPATVGTFPKVLADARDHRRFTMEDAIRRMTSASAERFALRDRGRIEKGMAADLVVFDPETITDTPSRAGRPAGRPRGIDSVFVNGQEVVKNGAYAGPRAGRVLRPSS